MESYNQTGGTLVPQTVATVLCCNCGQPIDGTQGMAMCYDCIKLTCDITQEIPRESSISFCRNCERFFQPPSQWITAQPESRELLALLLRRLKGLNKVRLTDAKFIWTEPHSRRLRVKLAVQGEAVPGVIIQQSFEVEYVVVATQCPDCAKSFTVNTWRACIQIRQKVTHKRTFFYLEQLILKHNAHMDTVSIKESRDGIDFFYSQKNHALRMIDFLDNVTPIKYKRAEELISMDTHTGDKNYKFSYSVEIVPICRDDLVAIPKSFAQSLGGISQLALCSKIGKTVQFLDPFTLQTADINASIYWRSPFSSLSDASHMLQFIVLDIEPLGPSRGKYALADVLVARASDITSNSQTYSVRTHLGGILHPGDYTLGYFLASQNFNNKIWDSLSNRYDLPDVVLVKKFYPKRRKAKNRNWKLQRMAVEHNDELRLAESEKIERDYEFFLQELEEDPELRDTVNLYKKSNSQTESNAALPAHSEDAMEEDEDEDEAGPTIGVDELLDDLEGMTINE